MISNRQQLKSTTHCRAGMTRADLVVIIVVAVVGFTLIVPAIQRPHGAARRTECLNKLKNLSLAMTNYTVSQEGKLPPLFAQYATNTTDGTPIVYPWTVALLPHLDAAALHRELTTDASLGVGDNSLFDDPNRDPVILEAFTCPVDSNNDRQPGGLSYQVNAGYTSAALFASPLMGIGSFDIDWNSNEIADAEDAEIAHATGVFFANDWNAIDIRDEFQMTFDYISAHDGTANTILIAENCQAGGWDRVNPKGVAFKAIVDPAALGSSEGRLTIPDNWNSTNLGDSWPGTNMTARRAKMPRPNSEHPGTFNVAYCDGRAKSLNFNMDTRVYLHLVSSAGWRYGQPTLDE